MENNSFNFIISKLNEAIAKNDKKGCKEIAYLINSIGDPVLIDILKKLNAPNIDENYIYESFDKESSLSKKIIISGMVSLFEQEKGILDLKNNWENIYLKVLSKVTYENKGQNRNYPILSKYIKEKKTNFYHYACASISKKNRGNCLMMLKGWSSSTPLINSPKFRNQKFGGGFYFRYNNIGFAVDPGCNFVENMHEQGIYINDIDYVIITHSHIDHNHDMETLATMNYEFNKIICDRSFTKFKHLKKHKIKWYVDSTTFDKIFSNGDIENTYPTTQHSFTKIELSQKSTVPRILANAPVKTIQDEFSSTIIEISYFPTIHNCKGSFGFKISLVDKNTPSNKITIGYTSDTAYFDKLSSNLDNCDILISNVSELSENDLLEKTNNSDSHLRLQGCINLIEEMDKKPKVYIISEFWGGKDDIRLYITKTIVDKINTTYFKPEYSYTKPSVLAGDVGLNIELNDLLPQCSFCKKYSLAKSIHMVLTGPYERLRYVCDDCCAHT